MYSRFQKDKKLCQKCRSCAKLIPCPVDFMESDCTGCGACALACPFEAIKMAATEKGKRPLIEVEIDSKKHAVPQKITVKRALEEAGYKYSNGPEAPENRTGDFFAPCAVGGCYSCALEIDGACAPACVTAVREGMQIKTELPADFAPRRLVGGFMGHAVGGVGTPWNLKGWGYVETAIFTAGCNLRCPQCQNWSSAYRGKEDHAYRDLTSQEAAQRMTTARKKYAVDRMAVSGGECTLNRKWLLEYLHELKKLNADQMARLHVDTNGSLLSQDYIDELVEAGMTDIGIDLKGLRVETFMEITGLGNRQLAGRYLQTAWQAVKYIAANYRGRVFLGVGIPYNEDLISLEEIEAIGEEISKIDPHIQVCPLDYRPEFRRMDLSRPAYSEMKAVYEVLKGTGLETVVCQTVRGYIGP